MPSKIDIKKVLARNKLAPSKQRGQNFLVNPQTSEAIVHRAGVTRDDTIIELGVGLGSLTIPLAEKAGKIIGIEVDRGIIEWHEKQQILPDNVSLIHQDLMKYDFRELFEKTGKKLKIVANLPYSLSNPLLFRLLEYRDIMEYAVLMLQKEVGLRLAAGPGSKTYGVLSVLLSGYATVTKIMDVGPGQFHPRPKVDSVVVRIVFDPKTERAAQIVPHDYQLVKKLVNAAFQQRRKTLLNSLSSSRIPGTEKETLTKKLEISEIDPKIRPEMLKIEDFIRIANNINS